MDLGDFLDDGENEMNSDQEIESILKEDSEDEDHPNNHHSEGEQ